MGDPKVVNPFVPSADPSSPSISGWAKSVVLGGPPTPSATMREVPSIVAGAVPAYGRALYDSANPTAAPTNEPSADPAYSPGGGTDMRANDGANQGIVADAELEKFLLDQGPVPRAAPDFFRPNGGDYSSIGGEEGKAQFQKTFAERPEKIAEAHEATQKAIGERSDALGKFYDEQSQRDAQMAAATQQRRATDQAETEMRQQKLDKATQYYSDDLANQGKFWTNPGNIVSAIAYSLLPIFSNDPAIGAKLINQAVEQDMANRQHAASQTLGALRSNLDGYHKIAGDRQAGDLLAQSEAHRLAANEVQRISQKFESPISKNNAEALFQSQMMQADTLKMEFFNKYINQPVRKMAPGEFAARGKGYDGAFSAYGAGGPQAPGGGLPTGSGVSGTIGGTASAASPEGNNRGFSAAVKPATIAAINASPKPMEATSRAIIEGRIPGGADSAIAAKQAMLKHAYAMSGGHPEKVQENMAKLISSAREELKGSTDLQKVAGQSATVSNLQTRLDIIRRSEVQFGRDPAGFLNSARAYMPSAWVQKYEDMQATRGSSPVNKAQELAKMHEESAATLRQEIAHLVNSYTLKYSGSAVSEGDAARMAKVISEDKSLGAASNWIRLQSTELEAERRASLSRLSPVAQLFYRANNGMSSQPLPTPGMQEPKLPIGDGERPAAKRPPGPARGGGG